EPHSLSLHDALPISDVVLAVHHVDPDVGMFGEERVAQLHGALTEGHPVHRLPGGALPGAEAEEVTEDAVPVAEDDAHAPVRILPGHEPEGLAEAAGAASTDLAVLGKGGVQVPGVAPDLLQAGPQVGVRH